MDEETFVSEIYHRVKNNLQMVCSMLRMQMREVDSVAAKEALASAIRRINSLSLAYELISRCEEEPDFFEFIRRIMEELINFSLMPGQRIRYEIYGEEMRVPSCINLVHLSTVLSETIVNAIKHGFCGVNDGKIEVNLSREGEYIVIKISDDGVGLPSRFKEGLGLKLVKGIVERDMRGSFKLLPREGRGTVAVIKVRC